MSAVPAPATKLIHEFQSDAVADGDGDGDGGGGDLATKLICGLQNDGDGRILQTALLGRQSSDIQAAVVLLLPQHVSSNGT